MIYAIFDLTSSMSQNMNSTRKEGNNPKTNQSNESSIFRYEVLTTEELAERLSVSPRTIFNMRSDGRIPQIRIGSIVRFVYSDVVEALREEGRAA